MPVFKKRSKPVALESIAHLDELTSSGLPVLVDFFQHGCAPCQVMDGIVNEIAVEFEGRAHVVKANARAVPEVFDRFKVRSTPTLMVLTRRPGANAPTQRFRAGGLVRKDQLVKSLRSAGAGD